MKSNAPKCYIVVCHGCGIIHEVARLGLVASKLGMLLDAPNGTKWWLPCEGCPQCKKEDSDLLARQVTDGLDEEVLKVAQRNFIKYLPRIVQIQKKAGRTK